MGRQWIHICVASAPAQGQDTFIIGGVKRMRVPVYREDGQHFHADACAPVVRAVQSGALSLEALARGTYPGRRLPDGALAGLSSAGYWDARYPQDWFLDWHRNEGIEITFLENGGSAFCLEGSRHELLPGMITITRPWQPHRVGDPVVGIGRLHWIILDVGVRRPHQDWQWPRWIVLTDDDLAQLTLMLRQNEQPVWRASPAIIACFKRLADLVQGDGSVARLSAIAVQINEVLVLLLDMLRVEKPALDETLTGSLRTARLFLEELRATAGEEEWTAERMAAACGLGVTRFTHYCRQITNMSPMKYLARVRLEQAERALRECPDDSITGIAFKFGFASSAYFAKLFRERYGQTPSDYRTGRALTM